MAWVFLTYYDEALIGDFYGFKKAFAERHTSINLYAFFEYLKHIVQSELGH